MLSKEQTEEIKKTFGEKYHLIGSGTQDDGWEGVTIWKDGEEIFAALKPSRRAYQHGLTLCHGANKVPELKVQLKEARVLLEKARPKIAAHNQNTWQATGEYNPHLDWLVGKINAFLAKTEDKDAD